jgi:hypothetical protein
MGLARKASAPPLERLALRLGGHVGRKHDHRNALAPPSHQPQRLQRLQPTHARHVAVQDDEIRRVALERVQRLLPVVHQRDRVTAALQDPADHLAVGRVVVRDQDAQGRRGAGAARVVLQADHALAHLVTGRDRMQHVEQAPLVERQLEHRGESGGKHLETAHVGLARHRENGGRRGIGRGAAETLREPGVLARGVEQRAVVGLRQADLRYQARHPVFHRGCEECDRAPARQGLLQRGTLGRREADEQDARLLQLTRGLAAACRRALGLLVEVHLDPEGAAEAERAFDPDAPAHQADELLRDGGAESRAAEAARGGLVCLGEAVEDLALRLGRDADAGVADRELEAHHRVGLGLHRHVHRHAAPLGELHRVAGEVDQHLAQVVRVAAHLRRHLGHDRDHELDALRGGLRRNDAASAVDERVQVEVGLLDHHLAASILEKSSTSSTRPSITPRRSCAASAACRPARG